MGEYRRGAQTVFEIHVHIVFTTKYPRSVLTGEVGARARDLMRDICAQHEVKILKRHVAKEHVHLFLSIPPHVTISRLLEQGLQPVTKATALQAVVFTQGQLCVSPLYCSVKLPNAQSLAISVMTQVQGIAASKASVQA
jgi:Transposase IS200 like